MQLNRSTVLAGDPVSSVTCTTTTLLIWQGSALNGQCNQNNILLEASLLTVENISDTFVCGDFTATLTNLTSTPIGQTTIVTLVSSLTVTATPPLPLMEQLSPVVMV